ncbi:hypothetical protein [Nocardia sp. CA-119907]|uniref:hypothetical protein n=1 Tax=Nocardia sp. CA-119907 TaxID=3239973 RepID=UPI003D98AC59
MKPDEPGGSARARARAVADSVLYEGYLLYPYRANARKNQSRWQFGVLGPVDAAESGLGEEARLSAQCPVDAAEGATIDLTVRFLQLQRRTVEDELGVSVPELRVGSRSWLSWDEAVEQELDFGPFPLADRTFRLAVEGGTEFEEIDDGAGNMVGRLVRTRCPLVGELTVTVHRAGGYHGLTIAVRNLGSPASDKDDAIARSFIGAHVLADIEGGDFVSLLDPPAEAADAVQRCSHYRCFPVLAGPPGDRSLLLISPIILYDHPQVAEQSPGPLFDSTEIDEILALRVMTLTDEEKEQARATDPRAAEIIDRCDSMTPDQLQELHGVVRDLRQPRVLPAIPDGVDWWDPLADNAVSPESDAVVVAGVLVSKGSRVVLRPSRRADAHDVFYDSMVARVTLVHEDVDGGVHIGVVVEDDPAAELHEWYGRYLYFAPDEIEPLEGS